jgi:hypothetical protein
LKEEVDVDALDDDGRGGSEWRVDEEKCLGGLGGGTEGWSE